MLCAPAENSLRFLAVFFFVALLCCSRLLLGWTLFMLLNLFLFRFAFFVRFHFALQWTACFVSSYLCRSFCSVLICCRFFFFRWRRYRRLHPQSIFPVCVYIRANNEILSVNFFSSFLCIYYNACVPLHFHKCVCECVCLCVSRCYVFCWNVCKLFSHFFWCFIARYSIFSARYWCIKCEILTSYFFFYIHRIKIVRIAGQLRRN